MTLSVLGALRVSDPHAWASQIRDAMAAANGRVGDAARTLCVSKRQLSRWLSELTDIPRAPRGRRFATPKTVCHT